jgi:hypothetical protein
MFNRMEVCSKQLHIKEFSKHSDHAVGENKAKKAQNKVKKYALKLNLPP